MYVFLSFVFFLVFSATFVKKWDNKLSGFLASQSLSQMANIDSIRKLDAKNNIINLTDLPIDSLEIDSLKRSLQQSRILKKDSLINAGLSNDKIIASLRQPGAEKASFFKKILQHTELNFLRNKGKGSVALFFSQLSIVIILNIIFFSLIAKLIYWRRKYYLPEHFVHTIYFFNFLLMMGIFCTLMYLLKPINYWIYLFFVSAVMYLFFSLKVFYKQGILKTFLKMLFLIAFCFPVVLALSVLMMASLTIYQYGQ